MVLLSICPQPDCQLAMYLTDNGEHYACEDHGRPAPDAELVLEAVM
jgi:hypothetical protein